MSSSTELTKRDRVQFFRPRPPTGFTRNFVPPRTPQTRRSYGIVGHIERTQTRPLGEDNALTGKSILLGQFESDWATWRRVRLQLDTEVDEEMKYSHFLENSNVRILAF